MKFSKLGLSAKTFITMTLCVFIIGISPRGYAAVTNGMCADLVMKLKNKTLALKQGGQDWIKNFKTKEGTKDNVLSLFLKKHNPDTDTRFFGFVTKVEDLPKNKRWYSSPIKSFMRASHVKAAEVLGRQRPQSTYYLSLFNGVQETLGSFPNYVVRPITRALLGQKMDLRLPIMLYLNYKTYQYLDNLYATHLNQKILNEAEEHGPEIDELLFHDFRYDSIRNMLESKMIDQKKARLMVLMYKKALDEYYSYMETEYASQPPNESLDKLLHSPMFEHINLYIQDYEQHPAGFRYSETANQPPTPEQIQSLMDANHMLLEKQNIIPIIVEAKSAQAKQSRHEQLSQSEQNSLSAIEEMSKDPARKEVLDDIMNSEYSKALFTLRSRGILSDKDLAYRLQEDAHFERKFIEYSILGVERLAKNENNEYTNEALTLEDIRHITIRQISREAAQRQKPNIANRSPSSIDGENEESSYRARDTFLATPPVFLF